MLAFTATPGRGYGKVSGHDIEAYCKCYNQGTHHNVECNITGHTTPTSTAINPDPDHDEPEVNRDNENRYLDLGLVGGRDVPSLSLVGTF